ncbi:protein BatD [Pseudoluteimonas lycopersici]|uniref:Protein BatD n=1 Tax=Pseudoluteimonas lycopersici TaxID=1324796 RepID=A0A516V548_9GAMM|nr:BatD family protein [Lysobacter lycopersici]QDQ73655.1 protein BatD [Lysobacter lycopersici]
MAKHGMRLLLCAMLALCAFAAQATTRAWLDRDRIAAGETATLNIETDQATLDSPDYSPLTADFDVSGNSSSRQFEMVNGTSTTKVLFAVALQPHRDGVIGIPALIVGRERTQPLSLIVTPAAASPVAHAGDAVFIEAEADAQSPYVQQAVGYVLRLYSAAPLVSGQLDQDPPDGATMQRVGDDLQYTREIGGRRYTVVERRFLLIPERSGALTIPGARFSGQGVGGFFDDLFGDGRKDLRTNGAPRVLSVQPPPANAPQPWLPLRSLTLRYLSTPQSARAGEAATVTVEADADGASAAQMPELALAAPAGAQVFADPVQARDNFDGGRPQVQLTRKFSIVPARAGTLRIPGPRIAWWDVRAGVARTASLPDIVLRVAPGANGPNAANAAPVAANPAANDTARDGLRLPFVQGAVRPWALAAVVFAFLWLATLWWGLHRATPPVEAQVDAKPKPDAARSNKPALAQALAKGDPEAISQALCVAANAPDLDGVRAKLDDATQQSAVDALQRARWGDGNIVSALAALRSAFKRGPRWKAATAKAKELLPPLYPPG